MLRKKDKMNESSKQIWTLKMNKINNCSKQISVPTKTKWMINEQKTNADNTQMNDSSNQMPILWTCKWTTAKKEISVLRRNKKNWPLKTNINANNNQINHC